MTKSLLSIFGSKKKYLAAFFILIACVASLYWLRKSSSPQLIGTAYFSIKTDKKIAALTFDDGPAVPFTGDILDVLKEKDVKATFFVLGKHAQVHPELVQRIFDEGHEIGNHSWSHARLIFKTPSFIRDEIDRTDTLIRELGYTGPIHFRAPFGNKLVVLPWILKSMDRHHILFDVVGKDWEEDPPPIIAQRVTDQLHPGAIILLHDGDADNPKEDRSRTVQALKTIIESAKKQGYQFLTISELLKQDEGS